MKRMLMLNILLCFVSINSAFAEATLSLDNTVIEAGNQAILNLSISGVAGSYGGFNARLEMDSCLSVSNVTTGPLITGFTFDTHAALDGSTRTLGLIAYSGSSTFNNDGTLMVLTVQVDAGCTSGQKDIVFSSTDPDPLVNAKHAISNTNGTISVSHLVQNGYIVVVDINTDTDKDGMNDDWERQYFGDLSHDGTKDSDNDGYTDLQEYLNSLSGNDSEGNPWDPTVINAPGGPGYIDSRGSGSFWLLMMPVILNGATP